MVGGVCSGVRVCAWPAKANTIRSWRSASLSLALSYYGQANGNETKAVSHKPSTYFLQLLKRIECLVRPRFQLLLLPPSPCPSLLCWLLTVVAAVVELCFHLYRIRVALHGGVLREKKKIKSRGR